MAGAERTPRKLLCCSGKTIEQVGRQDDQVHQDFVRGKDHVARRGAACGEKGERQEERNGSNEDVAVDGNHPPERLRLEHP